LSFCDEVIAKSQAFIDDMEEEEEEEEEILREDSKNPILDLELSLEEEKRDSLLTESSTASFVTATSSCCNNNVISNGANSNSDSALGSLADRGHDLSEDDDEEVEAKRDHFAKSRKAQSSVEVR